MKLRKGVRAELQEILNEIMEKPETQYKNEDVQGIAKGCIWHCIQQDRLILA